MQRKLGSGRMDVGLWLDGIVALAERGTLVVGLVERGKLVVAHGMRIPMLGELRSIRGHGELESDGETILHFRNYPRMQEFYVDC